MPSGSSSVSMSDPKVSVLMSVYNGERYLREAIDSILNQTFQDFEFIIIDDGSTDHSPQILNSYEDPRIRLITNERNIGLSRSLNIGIDLCCGEYIARMDTDDISYPQRIRTQLNYLKLRKDIVVLASSADVYENEVQVMDAWLHTIGKDEYKNLSSDYLRTKLLFGNPVIHPSVMLRGEILKEVRYDESIQAAQDFKLWVDICDKHNIAILPKPLLVYRAHISQISRARGILQGECERAILSQQLEKLGISTSEEELLLHQSLKKINWLKKSELMDRALIQNWLKKLLRANKQRLLYRQDLLSNEIDRIWKAYQRKIYSSGLRSLLVNTKKLVRKTL